MDSGPLGFYAKISGSIMEARIKREETKMGTISLKEAMVHGEMAVGFAEVRRYVSAGAVYINGNLATDAEQLVEPGDRIQCGKKWYVVGGTGGFKWASVS